MATFRTNAGLCETCAFARVVESTRGSRFYMCRKSETDARFRKYPPLPVLRCQGYIESTKNDVETGRDNEASNN
jgi:hypothetical protein